MPRSPTQLPTAFEVRLKTQWESADTTEPRVMLDISKLACQADILPSARAALRRAAQPRGAADLRVPSRGSVGKGPTQLSESRARRQTQPGGSATPRCANRVPVRVDVMRRDGYTLPSGRTGVAATRRACEPL